MGRYENRFASDSVFQTRPQDTPSRFPRAEVVQRLTNPRGLGVGPARLVAVVDETVQEALEESPLVLWETEEIIRFELPEARLILALSEGDTPGQFGLTLAVVFECEKAAEIAEALARLVLRCIQRRFPTFEMAETDGAFATGPALDLEVAALMAQPLSGSLPGLPPVDDLAAAMWSRAEACTPLQPRRSLPPLSAPPSASLVQSLWQRLARTMTPPTIRPMRHSVRALAILLFAMGLLQGPLGESAQAETQSETP